MNPGMHRRTRRLWVERRIGRPLLPTEIVWDCLGSLVVSNQSYMAELLHRRDALLATGNPKARKCCYCGQYDESGALVVYPKCAMYPACSLAYGRERIARNANNRKAKRHLYHEGRRA